MGVRRACRRARDCRCHADLWLQNPEPILETWPPELLAEAARLRQKLVPPAEKRYDAQWNLDPQANDSM